MSHPLSNGNSGPDFRASPGHRPAPLAHAGHARVRRTRPTIHELLPRVMRAIGVVEKRREHLEHHYRFRSVDDALNAVQPVLVQHRVSVSFNCFDHRITMHRLADGRGRARSVCRATLSLELTFWAPDGSSVTSTAVGEGCDATGDKASAKAMASAMKHALFYGLLIPVGVDDFGELQAGHGETEQEAP